MKAMKKWTHPFNTVLTGQAIPEHNGLIVWEVPIKEITINGKRKIKTFICVARSMSNQEDVEGKTREFWEKRYEYDGMTPAEQSTAAR